MSMTGKKRIIIPAVFMLAAVALFMYAPVSQYLDEKIRLTSYTGYSASPSDEAQYEKEWQKAIEYNSSLCGDVVGDPFVDGSGTALPQNYAQVLNVDGIMGYIDIPKISVLLPIYHGTSEDALQKGAGHIQQTSMPVGGAGTHCAISAHTGLPNAMMFDSLTSLEAGDHFYLHVLGHTLAYEVDEINTVLPYEFGALLEPIPGEDHVTLLTCTPFGVNSHRLLVRGRRMDYEESAAKQMAEEEKISAESPALAKLKSRAVIAGSAVLIMSAAFAVIPRAAAYGAKKKGCRGSQGGELQ